MKFVAKLVLAGCVLLFGCDEGTVVRRLGTDADVNGDALGGGCCATGGHDSGTAPTDAGTTTSMCTLGDPLVLTTVASNQTLEPVLATLGGDTVVAWVEVRLGVTDVYARGVTSSGTLGPEVQVTDDTAIEAGISLMPSGTEFLLAYSSSLLGGTDLTTVVFDADTAVVATPHPLTSDIVSDLAPLVYSTSSGATLLWERTLAVPGVFRIGLDATGAAGDAAAASSMVRGWPAPYAIDPTSNSIRLYHRLDATTLESVKLDTTGLELEPDPDLVSIDFSGYDLGTRLRTTAANASPRGIVVAADDGSNETALLQRISSSGAATGPPIEVGVSTGPLNAAVATFSSRYVVVYRTSDGSTTELRMHAYRSSGSIGDDISIMPLESSTGAVEIIARATGTSMTLIVDDVVGTTRELRAYALTCTLN